MQVTLSLCDTLRLLYHRAINPVMEVQRNLSYTPNTSQNHTTTVYCRGAEYKSPYFTHQQELTVQLQIAMSILLLAGSTNELDAVSQWLLISLSLYLSICEWGSVALRLSLSGVDT